MKLRDLFRSAGGTLQLPERRVETLTAAQLIAEQRMGRISAGVVVNDMTAMQLSAVWGCVDLLAELVSTTPIDEYRKVNGIPIEQTPTQLLTDPAGDGTGIEVWLRQMVVSGLLRGNLYGFIHQLGPDGWPIQIESLHPDRVQWRRDRNFGPVESYLDGIFVQRWPLGPLWHVPVYPLPGSPVGMSPIQFAAQTIGLGLGAQKYGAEWFGNGKIPPATLESDQVIDGTQALALKGRVNDALSDGGPLVLGAGLKFNPISVNPEEAQFLETIKANADDVARFFFRRPPGEGGQVTYANVEARSLDLLTYNSGWFVRLEKAISRLRPRPRYTKFNLDALLRVDALTRARVLDIKVRNGTFSRDEAREKDDLSPIKDGTGGEFVWPPGATSVAAMEEGGANDGSTQSAGPGTPKAG